MLDQDKLERMAAKQSVYFNLVSVMYVDAEVAKG
jgi:hypothetical protein